jgi:hypothetical protein
MKKVNSGKRKDIEIRRSKTRSAIVDIWYNLIELRGILSRIFVVIELRDILYLVTRVWCRLICILLLLPMRKAFDMVALLLLCQESGVLLSTKDFEVRIALAWKACARLVKV